MTKKHLPWAVSMVVFILIAMIAIGLIFQPVTIHQVSSFNTDNERYFAPSALTVQGMELRAEAWKELPGYNIGLGIIALIAFGGAIYACSNMYSLKGIGDEVF